MPMVNGKEYPYSKEGKAEARKAAKRAAVAKKTGSKKKQNWSGVKSQIYGM
jgi:hypothetical protein